MTDYQNTQDITARKRHQCWWCLESINPGEPYVRVSGRYEGEWFRVAEHPECGDAVGRFYADDGCADYINPPYKRGKTPAESEEVTP